MKKLRLLIPVLVLVTLVLAGCAGSNPFAASPTSTPLPPVETGGAMSVEGRVIPRQYVDLAFTAPGRIDAIQVREGDLVEAGALLMKQANPEPIQAQLANAKAQELNAQQTLDRLHRRADLASAAAQQALVNANQALTDARKALAEIDTDDYKDRLDDKETALQDAKDDLKDAEEEADKTRNLDADNKQRKDNETKVEDMQKALDAAQRDLDTLKNEMDQARARVTEAEAAVADAQEEVTKRAAGPDPDDLALAQAQIDGAKAAVAAAQNALDNLELKSPITGTVADLRGLEAGQWVNAGFTAVTVADLSEFELETKDLNELEVVNVSVGQKVLVSVDALPDVTLKGEVLWIKPVYTERSGDVLYTVRIKLTKTDAQLRWGMTVQIEFD